MRVPAIEGKLAPLPEDSLAAALDWPGLVVVGSDGAGVGVIFEY